MMELMHDVPNGVVGVRITDTLTAEDYTSVLEPALDAAGGDRLRVLIEAPDGMPHLTAGAIGADVRMGMRRLTDFAKLAVVTDDRTLTRIMPVASALVPGEVRAWPGDSRALAIEWLERVDD
jgi:hypothetical protein